MLKQLKLRAELKQRQVELEKLNIQKKDFEKRKSDLDASLEEAKTDEDINLVNQNIEALDKETNDADVDNKIGSVSSEITRIENEIKELDEKPDSAPKTTENENNERGAKTMPITRGFFNGISAERRDAFLQDKEIKEFLTRVREFKAQNRAVTGADLTIPTIALELLRDNLYRYSKLINKIKLKTVKGKARQNIAGTIPEGVWTETLGKLNELTLDFNQIEVDGYKVGGFIPVPNSYLEDSDLNLASEIMDCLGQAIGLAVDKAILFGTGVKMPLGIATRIAQSVKPTDWNDNGPAWTDLHTSNLLKVDGTTLTDSKFFAALLLQLGVAKPNYASGGTFWAMNRKTKMTLMSKAVAFNAAGAIVAGGMGTMPIEGGEIVELDFIADNDIVGGFGSLYLLAERAGAQLESSEHVKFLEDQTVFKGTARYDGEPVFGESFIMVNIANVAPTTTATFPTDSANA